MLGERARERDEGVEEAMNTRGLDGAGGRGEVHGRKRWPSLLFK